MFFALWVPVIFVWGAGVTGLWVVYLQCPGQISSKYGQNTGGSTFEHRTSAENPWKANWNIRNTMGIWQVKPWKVTLQTCTRFKLQECQHGLQCWSREGRSFLRWGETSTHFWMGGLQTIFSTCMNLTFYFLSTLFMFSDAHVVSLIQLYSKKSISPSISISISRKSAFIHVEWTLDGSLQPRKVNFIDLFSMAFKVTIATIRGLVDVITGTPHLDAKVVGFLGFLSMWIGNQQNRVGSLLTS